MIPYRNKDGKESGVVAYELGIDSISVKFRTGDLYLYNYSSAGEEAVEKMKRYAEANKGLSTYISRNIPPYAKKWFNGSELLV
jgi:hypothetical protein